MPGSRARRHHGQPILWIFPCDSVRVDRFSLSVSLCCTLVPLRMFPEYNLFFYGLKAGGRTVTLLPASVTTVVFFQTDVYSSCIYSYWLGSCFPWRSRRRVQGLKRWVEGMKTRVSFVSNGSSQSSNCINDNEKLPI